jgi:hypothetical protein
MDQPRVVLAAQLDGRLDSRLDGKSVLALPRGADVLALAGAWFPAATWTRAPVTAQQAAASARPMTGARFRGMVSEPAPTVAGLLGLTPAAALEGPSALAAKDAQSLGLGAREIDLYALDLTAGEPASEVVYGWMQAAARRVSGGIVPADRSRVLTPDPGAAVDLTLWSPVSLSPQDAVPLMRPAMSGARVGPADAPADGVFSITASFEYDGAITVRTGRSNEVPVALSQLEWRAYGPWAYSVHWEPPEPEELLVEAPSQLHLIARSRVRSSVARIAAALLAGAGGTVVDSGGFVVPPDELRAMATAAR